MVMRAMAVKEGRPTAMNMLGRRSGARRPN